MRTDDLDRALAKANPISRTAVERAALRAGEELVPAILAGPRGLPSEAETVASARPRVHFWHTVATRRAWRLCAAGLACLSFGGTAMATGVWDPGIGIRATDSSPPSTSATPVSTAAIESLAVLRRDPTEQDRGPDVEATLSLLGSSFGFPRSSSSDSTSAGGLLPYFRYGVKGVRVDSVRYLAPGGGGTATILFSVEDAGFGLFNALGSTGSGDEPAYLDGQGICVYAPSESGMLSPSSIVGTPICFVLADILDGRAVWWSEGGAGPSGEAAGIVPDGVASVSARFPNGTEVGTPVANNYFRLSWGPAESGPVTGSETQEAPDASWDEPTEFLWHDAGGAIVHR